MAIGITFIYSIMKMINWAMGEFYMVGSYLQFFFITRFLGADNWVPALILSMISVFAIGMVIQKVLISPMFVGAMERREDYATIVTISLSVLFRNLMVVIMGPYIFSVPDYAPPTEIGPLPISGNRLVALIATFAILVGFYIFIKYTWVGYGLRATAQNRFGSQSLGVDARKMDMIGFGIGVALAAAAGAILAPTFLIFPENGTIPTIKGFEIIVIGGLGSILGSFVASVLLGVVEALGTVLINPSYKEVYGFIMLMLILVLRPRGLFGEAERPA